MGRQAIAEGGTNALDHFCDFTDPMDCGVGERLHDGRSHSYLARHRYHRARGPACSGTKSVVAMGTFA